MFVGRTVTVVHTPVSDGQSSSRGHRNLIGFQGEKCHCVEGTIPGPRFV